MQFIRGGEDGSGSGLILREAEGNERGINKLTRTLRDRLKTDYDLARLQFCGLLEVERIATCSLSYLLYCCWGLLPILAGGQSIFPDCFGCFLRLSLSPQPLGFSLADAGLNISGT
jgi:hypothetical protein